MNRIVGLAVFTVVFGVTQAVWAGDASQVVRVDGNPFGPVDRMTNRVDDHAGQGWTRLEMVKNDRPAHLRDAPMFDHEAKSAKMAEPMVVEATRTRPDLAAESAVLPALSLAPVCLNSYCGTTGQMLMVRAADRPLAIDAIKKA